MKGQILGYNTSTSEGVIRGKDDKRYNFKADDFNAEQAPNSGLEVDFVVSNGIAKDIYISQMAVAAGKGLHDFQNKAADMAQNIASNENLMQAKETAMTNFLNAPFAIVALLVYTVASFIAFASLQVGFGGLQIALIDTSIGKIVPVLTLALLALLITSATTTQLRRTLTIGVSIVLVFLPFVALYMEVSPLFDVMGSMGTSFPIDKVIKAMLRSGNVEIGGYLMLVSAIVLRWSEPTKKEKLS